MWSMYRFAVIFFYFLLTQNHYNLSEKFVENEQFIENEFFIKFLVGIGIQIERTNHEKRKDFLNVLFLSKN